MSEPVVAPDPFDVRRAGTAPGLLREFNDSGVLSPADVHVARRLGELAGEQDDAVLLGAALAVRGPRLGHVHVDLVTIRDTAAVDAAQTRLAAEGLASVDERGTTCCYAKQDKFWVQGAPNGEPWEIYTVVADSATFRDETESQDGCCGGGATAEGEPATAACC